MVVVVVAIVSVVVFAFVVAVVFGLVGRLLVVVG